MTNIKSKNIKSSKQKGGDGYTIDVNRSIGGLVGRSRYSYNYSPVYYGDLLQNGGNKDCGCSTKKENNLYSLIKQNGGVKSGGTQVEAIQYISNLIAPLGYDSLISLILLIFSYHYFTKDGNTMKMKKGGYDVSSVLAPLGRSNLIVLASLLLLHHFAVELPNTKKVLKGGNNIFEDLSNILKPIGLDKNGVSKILVDLQQAFTLKKNNKEISKKNINNTESPRNFTKLNNQNNKEIKNNINADISKNNKFGGNALKNIIAPLGTNAFVASGLLVVLAKVLNKEKDNKSKKGGSLNTNINKLKNIITPISFTAFANESFVKELLEEHKSKQTSKRVQKGGRGGRGAGSLGGLGNLQGRAVSRPAHNPASVGRFDGRIDHAYGNLVPARAVLATGAVGSYAANNYITDPQVANVLNINRVDSELMNGGKKKIIKKKSTKLVTKRKSYKMKLNNLSKKGTKLPVKIAHAKSSTKITPTKSSTKITPTKSSTKITPNKSSTKITPNKSSTKITPNKSSTKITPNKSSTKITPTKSSTKKKSVTKSNKKGFKLVSNPKKM